MISDLVTIDQNGFKSVDYPTILQYLVDEYHTIFGIDTYLEPDSQDGQWIAVIALAIFDTLQLTAKTYNSFSPSTAQGDALSRNVKINGIKRRSPTYSSADLTIIGVPGTVISAGQARDLLNQKWLLPVNVTIPPNATIEVTAFADDIGAIRAEPNTITKIATPVLGWQSVRNTLASTVGVAVEADSQLRSRQRVSTALPSLSVMDGMIGAVANVPGVSRFRGYENDTDITDNDGILPHHVAMVIEGGDAQALADTIAVKKTQGTGTFGTTVAVSYDIKGVPNVIRFFRPTVVVIKVYISIIALTGYTTGYSELIKLNIAKFINTLNIGADVLITKLYVPANLIGTSAGHTFDVTEITIARNAEVLSDSNINITFNEVAGCNPLSDVTIVVG